MFNVYDYYGDRVFQSEDIDDIKEFLENHIDYRDDYDFLDMVDDEINNYSEIDFGGSDFDLTAAEILKEMRPDYYEDLVNEYFERMVDDRLYEIEHGYYSRIEIGEYTIVDSDEESEEDSPIDSEMIRVYAHKGEQIRLEDIFETREEAQKACRELNDHAYNHGTMTTYFIGSDDYRPTKEHIMVGL